MEIKVDEAEGLEDLVIVRVQGKVLGGIDQVSDIRKALGEHKDIIMDLTDVPWCNSSGKNILVSAHDYVTKRGNYFHFLDTPQRVKSILMTSKILTVFDSSYNEEDAINKYREHLQAN